MYHVACMTSIVQYTLYVLRVSAQDPAEVLTTKYVLSYMQLAYIGFY